MTAITFSLKPFLNGCAECMMSAQEPGTTNTKYNVTYIATKEITTSQNDEIDCLGIKFEAGPVILGDGKVHVGVASHYSV